MADVVAIIVTWNSASVIRACLESLRSEPTDVVVVDNASSDDTKSIARQAMPGALFLANEKNLGFAGAANTAIRSTRQPFVLLLNPDTVLHPGAVTHLRAALNEDAQVAAAGGLLLDAGGEPQRGFYVRRFPTVAAMAFEALLLNHLWPSNPVNRCYRCLDFDPGQAADIDQPAGACLMLRRAALEQIGLLDEQFHPLWFEDVDLCLRLRRGGWRLRYCPAARVSHLGGYSLELLQETETQQYWYRNLLRFFATHHGLLRTSLLRLAVAFGMLLRILALGVASAPRGSAKAEAVRAYWRVFKNCWTSA